MIEDTLGSAQPPHSSYVYHEDKILDGYAAYLPLMWNQNTALPIHPFKTLY